MQQWIAIKNEIAVWLALDRDALHLLAGLGLHFLAAILLRRPLSNPLLWLAVLLVEIGNEAASGYADGLLEDWEIAGSLHDLWVVMVVPTLLLVLTRFLPVMFNRPKTRIVTSALPMLDRAAPRREIEDAEFSDIDEEPPAPKETGRS
jgi:hypothetical protein